MSTLPFEAASRQWMKQINRKVPVADHPRDLVSMVSSIGDQVVTPIGRRYNARVTMGGPKRMRMGGVMGGPMRMKKGGKVHSRKAALMKAIRANKRMSSAAKAKALRTLGK